jgi:hypothetical protein
MAVSVKAAPTRKYLHAWPESDARIFAISHILQPFFVISLLRYDVMGTIVRRGISVL